MFDLEQHTPKELGYRFPAEWEPHRATWLSYPHEGSYSWPGTLPKIYPFYNKFIREISKGEQVCINIRNNKLKEQVAKELDKIGVDLNRITFYLNPTNDAWCRDHGPAFLINPEAKDPKVIVSWKYNAWGGKYDHDLDDKIPMLVGQYLELPVFYPRIVMEGGAVDFNGNGTLLTTTACLLHENRNPGMFQHEIEEKLRDYYGVDQILWLDEGIDGDDTNGHIDDITRFYKEDGVVTVIEPNKLDANYKPLKTNLKKLKEFRLPNGKQMDIVELPMPKPVVYEDQRLPASYANFYISNHAVIVPTFRCREDDVALSILEECFPDRQVVGIDSVEIIWGLGSWHCLSQQEPR
ncbi:MAG: agmatine deiminase family protein [Bacteroidales bacterium]|nr:agmatine deiminase family protein [Bacteroidales bacterium]